MLKLPKNLDNVDSRVRRNPVKMVLIILILTIAVADFVMIAELPFWVSNLQTGGKNSGPEHALSHDPKEQDNLDGSAKDRMTRMTEAAAEPVYLLDRSRRYDHRLEK
jgi:hypothetical protein